MSHYELRLHISLTDLSHKQTRIIHKKMACEGYSRWKKKRAELITSTMSTRRSPDIELFRSELLRSRMRADSEYPFHGATTPLHVACSIGVPPHAIAYFLSQKCNIQVASVTDIKGMVPLHHIVQAICDGKILYDDGITVIKMLCDADSTMVHKADKQSNTPIDVVQKSRCSSTSSCSEERLIQLYQYLRSISFLVYREKRSRWEAEGFDQELHDESRSSDCGDLSVTPLHNELNDDNTFDTSSRSTAPSTCIKE